MFVIVLVAVASMAMFVVIKLYGVRRLMRANNAITTWNVVNPTSRRPFRLRGGEFWAPVAFIVSNLIIY